jgi:hypothetical protein
MNPSHTPGPWTMYEHRPQHATVSEFNINAKCSAGQGYASEGWFYLVNRVNGGNDEECHANARLIAATPDLLDALNQIALLAEWQTTGPSKCSSGPLTAKQATSLRLAISDIARAAIAKATGVQA